MEVGHQRVDDPELEAGVDKEAGPARLRRDDAAARTSRRFERTRRGRADRHDSPFFASRAVNRICGRLADGEAFRIDRVRFDLVDTNWLERSVADMQRNGGALNAARAQFGEYFGREMEAGSRRRDRAALARIHRLIALEIAFRVGAFDIGWQRDVPNVVNGVFEADAVFRPKAYRAPAMEMPVDDFRMKFVPRTSKHHLRSGLQLLPGMN